ncbi:hypothetical protein IPC1147_32975 [Pseudomonas aeruginosa]|uniref:hypothetical protein n=1 Tax=Pseudomonas aeruginosa TaxID=287 RepID=UPI000F526B52|nr:hypothetical protein [Pseudomonas aeruginosa]MBA5106132.1 hypothetical protein [Pseudomonas aeruginosa]MBD1300815.1 hypothetical protein [Pseudomonas aeruginosa]MBD1341577.1 hypothetical protein [Pseudomonas aeruginosa]MBH3592901.1 hypothetical protein [Pseudomonas aeruginosa]MCO2528508.1 hypothetical protein [Pseudomonas aeruginosa]
MHNLSAQQPHLAALFVAANRDRVESISCAAANLANAFLVRLASKVLCPATYNQLETLAKPETIHVFGQLLRQHAVEFIERRVSSAYWDLIDAIGSLGDATDARWPYMTMERRGVRLSHAQEHLAACERYLGDDVARIAA